MSEEQTKACTKCGEEKRIEFYSPNKKGKFGRTSICKSCARENAKIIRNIKDLSIYGRPNCLSKINCLSKSHLHCRKCVEASPEYQSRKVAQGRKSMASENNRKNASRNLKMLHQQEWFSKKVQETLSKPDVQTRRIQMLAIANRTRAQYESFLKQMAFEEQMEPSA